MAHVLLIEDDPSLRASCGSALARDGHGVVFAADGMRGLEEAVSSRPEVVILDLGLPDLDGLALLRMLRSVSDVPVIVATAQDDEGEIVRTLDAGADDYVIKPFSTSQLEARIRAVLRRHNDPRGDATIAVGGLRIDPNAHEASLDGCPLELTRLEFRLLHYLASHEGQVVRKSELIAAVWQQPHGGTDKTVDVHLSWLRRKLGETAAEPRYLHTVRGVGVKLAEPQPGLRPEAQPPTANLQEVTET